MKRLLLVEDEPGLVLTLSDRLGGEGYAVEATSDGESGLERAAGEGFDLIVLDVMLPSRAASTCCGNRAAAASIRRSSC